MEVFARSSNESDLLDGCDGHPERPSCLLTPSETGILDTIAALRMVISCLSLLGTSSLIGSAVKRHEVTHPKVHPIFSLALVDLLLAVLWIVGGGMWLRGVGDRNWCFAISLFTVILVCVSVNLTVVYSVVTYSTLKRTDLTALLANTDAGSKYGCLSAKSILAYSIACGVPVLVVLPLFGIVAGRTEIVQNVNSCTCWCAPVLGNVIPYATQRQEGPAEYVHDTRKLLVMYGLVIALHFLVGLIILIVLCSKSLKLARNNKNYISPSPVQCAYGTEDRGQRWTLFNKGESKSHKRVVYFLTVFIINGVFNFIFSAGIMIREAVQLQSREYNGTDSDFGSLSFYVIFVALQSVSITQQGFLNAMVYSWTHENLQHIVSFSRSGHSGDLELPIDSTSIRDGDSGEFSASWAIHDKEEANDELWETSRSQSIAPALSRKMISQHQTHSHT